MWVHFNTGDAGSIFLLICWVLHCILQGLTPHRTLASYLPLWQPQITYIGAFFIPVWRWDFYFSGMLWDVVWQFVTVVLGQTTGPVFNGQAVPLTLEGGSSRLSWNLGNKTTQTMCCQHPRLQLHCGGSLKSCRSKMVLKYYIDKKNLSLWLIIPPWWWM